MQIRYQVTLTEHSKKTRKISVNFPRNSTSFQKEPVKYLIFSANQVHPYSLVKIHLIIYQIYRVNKPQKCRRSSINFRGARHFCPKNMYEQLTKCLNFK